MHEVRVQRIPPSHERFDRVGLTNRLPFLAILLISTICIFSVGSVGSAHADTSDRDIEGRRPAVARPNARFSVSGEYTHTDSTKATTQSGGATSTLRIGELETKSGQAEIVGTLPLTHSTGARGKLRGHFSSQSEDGRSGNQDIDTGAYGAAAEFFLRDPELGSFTLGGSYDRLDGDDDFDANAFGGVADLRIFFPDMGSGEVDWFIRFDYERREVEGTGRPFDPRIDTYQVSGGAGWYLTDNFQLLLGGSWTRAENSPISREDSKGFVTVRWRLPTALSLELSLGGTAGVSEYKQSPFPSDDRLIYGGHVGVTYRFRSGATLVESIRAFD